MSTTIIVSPRERFTALAASLESLFNSISDDIPVIVVEGCSPGSVRKELEALQQSRAFDWISVDSFITPQEARNLGFAKVSSDHVVFTDNDIHYQQGWLQALERNAATHDSDLVAPLICIGPPEASIVHHAGGQLVIHKNEQARPHVTERHRLIDRPISELTDKTASIDNEIVEFHCFLAKSDYIRRIGPLDERLITREQIDFGLRAKVFGAKVTFEKDAIVTYMANIPFLEIDLPYMVFRWSDELAISSLRAFTETWGIRTDANRVLNGWIRQHRLRAFRSAFPAELERLGDERFARDFVAPREKNYVESAFSTRPGNKTVAFPSGPGKTAIADFFTGVETTKSKPATGRQRLVIGQHPMVVGGMATMPSRVDTLWQAINSILPQLDRLYLFFDRFEKPPIIRHPKIVCLNSQTFGDHRANGKFLGLLMSNRDPYYFSLDDDILYPKDYVQRMVGYLQENGDRVAVGVHGSILSAGFNRYLTDRNTAHRSKKTEEAQSVDILGTCTTAFRTRTISFDVRQWKQRNMVDLMFAHECKRHRIERRLIPRDEKWVQCLAENQADSIFLALNQDDRVQTKLARALLQDTPVA